MQQKAGRKQPGRWKKWAFVLAASLIFTQSYTPYIPQVKAAAESSIKLVSEEPVTSGAVLKKYIWNTVRKGQPVQVNANVVQVDLQNPYVKLDVMAGIGGQFTKKNSVLGMAQEYGAVAGTNGDFYNTQAEGVPEGPQITNGQLMATPPFLPGYYSFAITKDRKPIVDSFTFQGQVKAKDGSTFPLGGVNKTYYWFEPSEQESTIDGLFLYTNAWGQEDRANDGKTDPTEVLVEDNVVKQIVQHDILHMVPPKNGYILRSDGKAADFVVNHLKVGDSITADYAILPQDPNKNYDYKTFQMMIGGHTIMVDGGKPAEFSRDVSDLAGYRSRTGIGYSQDQRYVYLITADNSGDSKGLSMYDFQDLMVKVGVWKGLNLDGGGSTQMVARPLGQTDVQLINQTENGNQRRIVNSLGVFSTAPQGKPKGLKIDGPQEIFLNEKAVYGFSGYDEYYNPLPSSQVNAQWSSSRPIGSFTDNNTFTPTQKGTTTLRADSGLASATFDVRVIGGEDLASLKVAASPAILTEGADVALTVTAKTKSGTERQIPAETLQWDIQGINATVSGSTLHVNSLNGNKYGTIIGHYDSFSTIANLPTGDTKAWADFDGLGGDLVFTGTSGVTGTVNKESNPGWASGNYTTLQYDLSKATTGTKAAYASFGSDGAAIEGAPQTMKIDVYGDNSLNWLRGEFVDAKGSKQLIDLAKSVNWSGWQTLSVDLTAYKLAYPIKLNKLYVVSVEQGQDERALTGLVAFDNIKFQYKNDIPPLPKNQVKLTIDQKAISVNGQTETIDQAPVIVDGNTLVPIRFVTEAIGSKVDWYGDAGKASVERSGQLMDFWLGNKDYLADGLRKTAEVSPQLMNGRTMVPLRVLSEHFGWKVTWDGSTRTVTLE